MAMIPVTKGLPSSRGKIFYGEFGRTGLQDFQNRQDIVLRTSRCVARNKLSIDPVDPADSVILSIF
jgi:hypothetical protein